MRRVNEVFVVAMSAEDARAFFGQPATAIVIDEGPPGPRWWKPGARRWRVQIRRADTDATKNAL